MMCKNKEMLNLANGVRYRDRLKQGIYDPGIYEKSIEEDLKNHPKLQEEIDKDIYLQNLPRNTILNAWHDYRLDRMKPFPLGVLELNPKRMSSGEAEVFFEIIRASLLLGTAMSTIGSTYVAYASNTSILAVPISICGAGAIYKIVTHKAPEHVQMKRTLKEIVEYQIFWNPFLYDTKGDKSNER